jgi:peptidoglycan/LPS O-acetylase OafA/YrhL
LLVAAICGRWVSGFSFGNCSVAYYAIYLQNLVYAGGFPLAFTWSLAVEEHFYMVWPWTVSRLRSATLVRLLLAVVVLTPVIRALAQHAGFKGLYEMTPFRLDGLAIGALIAIGARSRRFSRAAWKAFGCIAISVAAPVVVYLFAHYRLAVRMSPIVHVSLSVFFGGIVILSLVAQQEGVLRRSLRWRPVRYIGKISYGLYLYNVAVLAVVSAVMRHFDWSSPLNETPRTVLLTILQITATIGIASLSWYAFERPFLRLKSRFEYGRRVHGSSAQKVDVTVGPEAIAEVLGQ